MVSEWIELVARALLLCCHTPVLCGHTAKEWIKLFSCIVFIFPFLLLVRSMLAASVNGLTICIHVVQDLFVVSFNDVISIME